jgi:hypothetical protein
MEEIQLKVEKAYPIDLGRGIVRLDPTALLKLQLSPGDIVEIRGKKKTTAVVWRSDREDWEKGLLRIDNFIRQNAGTLRGEKVTIKKVEAPKAKKLILALPESMTQEGSELQFGEHANEIMKRHILKRPVFRGDIIPIINSMSQPTTESLTTSQVIPLVAVETDPENTIVIISEQTEVILSKKPVYLGSYEVSTLIEGTEYSDRIETFLSYINNNNKIYPSLLKKAFVSDEPEVEKDYFKRKPFASRISNIIISRKEPSSIVIGIYGGWGEGKTTLLNFIARELKKNENTVCLWYNPWYYSDEVSLLLDFFNALADRLGEKIDSDELKNKVREQIKKYGRRISQISVSTIEANLGVIKLGAKTDPPSPDSFENLIEVKKNIQQMLKDNNKKIVVLMDDIDRLVS